MFFEKKEVALETQHSKSETGSKIHALSDGSQDITGTQCHMDMFECTISNQENESSGDLGI